MSDYTPSNRNRCSSFAYKNESLYTRFVCSCSPSSTSLNVASRSSSMVAPRSMPAARCGWSLSSSSTGRISHGRSVMPCSASRPSMCFRKKVLLMRYNGSKWSG